MKFFNHCTHLCGLFDFPFWNQTHRHLNCNCSIVDIINTLIYYFTDIGPKADHRSTYFYFVVNIRMGCIFSIYVIKACIGLWFNLCSLILCRLFVTRRSFSFMIAVRPIRIATSYSVQWNYAMWSCTGQETHFRTYLCRISFSLLS